MDEGFHTHDLLCVVNTCRLRPELGPFLVLLAESWVHPTASQLPRALPFLDGWYEEGDGK